MIDKPQILRNTSLSQFRVAPHQKKGKGGVEEKKEERGAH